MWVFKGVSCKSDNCFVKCVQNTFFGKFGHITSKYFVFIESQCKVVVKGADFEFDNCFLKFRP